MARHAWMVDVLLRLSDDGVIWLGAMRVLLEDFIELRSTSTTRTLRLSSSRHSSNHVVPQGGISAQRPFVSRLVTWKLIFSVTWFAAELYQGATCR